MRAPVGSLIAGSAALASVVGISRQANAQGTSPPAGDERGNHPAPNSVYAEGLGEAIVYSINYERIFVDQLAVRAGVGYFSVSTVQ